jgi:pyruvate ferredoxin oxidoreductase delta subunit
MSETRLKGWKELPIGGLILEPGKSEEYKTGTWRAFRPILQPDKCTHDLFCWLYCPDGAVLVEDGKMKGFDLYHCKGCGICAQVCPHKPSAITMVEEAEAKKAEEGK